MIGQAVLFYGVTLWGGTIQRVEANTYAILRQQVDNRSNYLENEMVRRWSNIGDIAERINGAYNQLVAASSGVAPTIPPIDVQDKLMQAVTNELLEATRKTGTTGVFVVLNSPKPTATGTGYPGLYIRNPDPGTSSKDNSDLSILRGPVDICRQLAISTDINWKPMFTLEENNRSFFDKPIEAAKQNPRLTLNSLGYWSPSYRFAPGSPLIISYTLPLLDATGKPYGVLGVEISEEYLQRLLPYREVVENGTGVYYLGMSSDGGTQFVHGASHASSLSKNRLHTGLIGVRPNENPARPAQLIAEQLPGEDMLSELHYLNLYDSTSPFVAEHWALMGLVSRDDLMCFAHGLHRTAVLTSLLCILLGACCTAILFRILTTPIHRMVKRLQTSDPHQPVELGSVGIGEIDQLADAIEQMSVRIVDSSSLLSRIIAMSDLEIAAFEIDRAAQRVNFTEHLFSLLGVSLPALVGTDGTINLSAFRELLEGSGIVLEEELTNGWMLRVNTEHKTARWVRLTVMTEVPHPLGVAVDITGDVLAKRRIEYERDYDLLTNLLNRRAYLQILEKLFKTPQKLGIAAMVLLDLDNLKHINDTYGHDYGDGYLQATANALKRFAAPNIVISRMSGDEFYLFLYGYQTKEEAQGMITALRNGIASSFFALPGTESIKIRCSAGVAWYPNDCQTVEQLIRFADFAMYTAKNTQKGEFSDFNLARYEQNSFLLHSREELNKLIEGRLVRYHFQPIVNARTGKVFSYEALMRSQLSTLRSPLEILTLARAQSKLYEIERLTWFVALQHAAESPDFLQGDYRLFINSVSNQTLTDSDLAKLQAQFEPCLHRVVLEVTEEEKFSEDLTRRKQDILSAWGAQIALDDYGTGYNGDTALLLLTPDYVKIDMSIVRNIDSDENRQDIFRNLVSYSHEHSILVIAEGVETFQEMQTLIELGADYLQGYFLGMPAADFAPIAEDLAEEIRNIAKK